MVEFDSLSTLVHWLGTSGIDTTAWGTFNAKSVADLWREIQEGETVICGNPPVRHVNVVMVRVRNGDAVLTEAAQIMHDGRVRRRWRVPSEKLFAQESYEAGAIRCLIEEVGVQATQVTVHPETHVVKTHTVESPSYPNLTSHYQIHHVDATVVGLPTADFRVPNHGHRTSDPVVAHDWTWHVEKSAE